MAGKTVIEKILSKKLGKDTHIGDRVWLPTDLVAMRDFGGPNVILEYKENFKDSPLFDKDKVAITFDLHIPPRDEKVANNHKICRDFVKKTGCKLFDVNEGIGQHILFEHNLVHPGDVIIGTDSHMNLLGAFEALAMGVGTTDITGAMRYGKLWYRIPPTIRIEINGKIKKPVCAKDVILYVLKNLKTDGAINKSVEFTGNTVKSMNTAERITLTSMVTEMSGEIGFVESKDSIFTADKDAIYESKYEFDVSKLEPQIACPHSPDLVKSVKEVAGTPIDQVFIGSCTNGKYEDLKAAADILKGKTAKIKLIIVPATMNVAKEALKKGLYEIFLSAGAVVVNPGCALCTTGHPGILANGETMVSTSNRNFIGKLGKGGEVYLASPATAAATAVTGKIAVPE
ncbi:MAG: aconitase/3-isopropylmalate dehydratase large subunit family protein [bacterium]|nr:aconitase/3-isopropylmalate dehydratase large subunit family protein [bacterium]